jgi:orotidine-5'-phosphate decarboxylase
MNRKDLYHLIRQKKSFLTVGLDPDLEKLPKGISKTPDGVFEFCKNIIASTQEYCVAYKPNLAFFEALGPAGWEVLNSLMPYFPDNSFTIADAKRGDIGNTSAMYARAFFDKLGFDAITIAPYMGSDSVKPFLEFPDKWVIILALTSNTGSKDFQFTTNKDTHKTLYQTVLETSSKWGNPDNTMYVIGATHPERFQEIRNILPEHFFLVPGVGAQGGDLVAVADHGMNENIGLLVNSSRGIIYAGDNIDDYCIKISAAAKSIQVQMENILLNTMQ